MDGAGKSPDVTRPLVPSDMRGHHPFGYQAKLRSRSLATGEGDIPDDALVERLLESACHRLDTGTGLNGTTKYVILSADIRKSTFLMKEAEDLAEYARVMTVFIMNARTIVGSCGGWFDKFMGDGFIAYWPLELFRVDPRSDDPGNLAASFLLSSSFGSLGHVHGEAPLGHISADVAAQVRDEAGRGLLGLASALKAAELLISNFEKEVKPEFRRNSRNFRADTGLGVGLDYGGVRLVQIGEEISVVGHPVVGAVRMTAEGAAGDIIGNSPVGELLLGSVGSNSGASHEVHSRFTMQGVVVTTKEYEQEAYKFYRRPGQ